MERCILSTDGTIQMGSHTLRYFNYITNEDYCEIREETHEECLKKIYEKPIWDGKKFWDAEPELEWIDPI